MTIVKEPTNTELLRFMKEQFEKNETYIERTKYQLVDRIMQTQFHLEEEISRVASRVHGNGNRIDTLAENVRMRDDIEERIGALERKVGT